MPVSLFRDRMSITKINYQLGEMKKQKKLLKRIEQLQSQKRKMFQDMLNVIDDPTGFRTHLIRTNYKNFMKDYGGIIMGWHVDFFDPFKNREEEM